MAELKFVGRISSQGKNLIIWIPKDFHKDAKALRGKQVKIVVDDNIWVEDLKTNKLSSISTDKIFINLDKIDPAISKIYHGAKAVLEDVNNPDRFAQSAHSIRETLNRLTGNIDIEYETTKRKQTKRKDTLKLKLWKENTNYSNHFLVDFKSL